MLLQQDSCPLPPPRAEEESEATAEPGVLRREHSRISAGPPRRGLSPSLWCPSGPAGARRGAARLQGKDRRCERHR